MRAVGKKTTVAFVAVLFLAACSGSSDQNEQAATTATPSSSGSATPSPSASRQPLKGNEIRALLRPVAAPACLRAVPKGPYQHHVVAVERIFLCPPGRTEPVVVQPGEFTKAEGVLNIIQLKTNTTTCDQIVLHHPWRLYVAEASDPSAADSGVYQVPVWRFCGKALLVPYLNELMDDISAA